MLSDSMLLAQGLFRMLFRAPMDPEWATVHNTGSDDPAIARALPLQPLDKVLLLRQNPLLARATITQLLELASIARDIALTPGSTLFAEDDSPALFHIMSGEIQLSANGNTPVAVKSGSIVGLSATLAGVAVGLRAVVTREGTALRLDREELFDVLTDHIDLLQSVFSGLLHAQETAIPLAHDKAGAIHSPGHAPSPTHR
jgi:hypothetical protein